jgi:hypothetical protein
MAMPVHTGQNRFEPEDKVHAQATQAACPNGDFFWNRCFQD